MRRLAGKVVVVAGAGGIGDALARRYAAEGAAVAVGDRNPATAQAVVAEIEAAGGRAVAAELDGAADASVAALVALAVERFGGLDGFHANYASFRDGQSGADIVDLPLAAFDEVMATNARGFVLCTRHAVPELVARGGGAILYTTSGAAFAGEPVRAAYAMSKVAVHALVRHVARRFGPQGVRANAIAPGVIAHAGFDAVMPADAVEEMRAGIPIGRLGRPEDIAALGALLLADEGSFITGQVLSVDGGASMRQ